MKFISKVFVCVFLFLLFAFSAVQANAAVSTQSAQTNIKVTVSGNSLSLTGYIAPFASVVLTINGTVITSTTADALGNFSFSNVGVPKATSIVCLDAVDYKKLGQSEACISVTPIDGVISKTGVFLPPTMGVQRVDVQVGNSAIAFGYGMPGATVTVHINGSAGCSVKADNTGYYTCSIVIQKAGSYELYADAVLNNKPSEAQLKKILIQGIGITKLTITPGPTPQQLPGLTLFEIPWWIWLLLVLISIILIIILLRKYRPGALPGVGVPSIRMNHLFDALFKNRKLHHAWMHGVGY